MASSASWASSTSRASPASSASLTREKTKRVADLATLFVYSAFAIIS